LQLPHSYDCLLKNKNLSRIVHNDVQDEDSMASGSQIDLKSAAEAASNSLARLEAAVAIASAERAASADARERIQAELTAQWQSQQSTLQTALDEANLEIELLREETQRLSNQLNALQQEHLDLQTTASSTLTRLNKSVSQMDLLLEQSA
jgi:chromosome segregation ATPase